jgi:hypothetical protein
MTDVKIKPSISEFIWVLILGFFLIGVIFLVNSNGEWTLLAAGFIFLSLTVSTLWAIDYTHLSVIVKNGEIRFEGFFNRRKINLFKDDISGYQIHQKADQYNGFHEEIQLVTKTHGTIIFPRAAYQNNYSDLRNYCGSNFEFIGYNKLKYGEMIGKVLVLMGSISGALAVLVGLLKFL